MIWRYPYFWKHPASQLSSVNNENRFPCLVADRPSLRWRFPARDRFASGPCNTGEKRGEILCLQRGLCDFWKIVEVWFDLFLVKKMTTKPWHQMNPYCWWLKSCTTKDDDYPIICMVSYIPGGARFQPSTVWWNHDSSWSVYSRKHCRIGSSWFQFVGWWDVFRRSNRNRLNSNVSGQFIINP